MKTLEMKVLLLAVCVAGVVALPFEIRDPNRDTVAEKPQETFERADQNKNGELTFEEFLLTDLLYVQLKKDEFDALDTNKDGTVSKTEYETHIRKEKETADDLRAEYFGQLYDQFDENFDLKLSEEEVRNIIEKRFLLKPRDNFSEIFKGFDTNKDGGLDLEEYIQFDAKLPFHELDPIDMAEQVPVKSPLLKYKQEKMPMAKRQD